jgi:hypothetical protein
MEKAKEGKRKGEQRAAGTAGSTNAFKVAAVVVVAERRSDRCSILKAGAVLESYCKKAIFLSLFPSLPPPPPLSSLT